MDGTAAYNHQFGDYQTARIEERVDVMAERRRDHGEGSWEVAGVHQEVKGGERRCRDQRRSDCHRVDQVRWDGAEKLAVEYGRPLRRQMRGSGSRGAQRGCGRCDSRLQRRDGDSQGLGMSTCDEAPAVAHGEFGGQASCEIVFGGGGREVAGRRRRSVMVVAGGGGTCTISRTCAISRGAELMFVSIT